MLKRGTSGFWSEANVTPDLCVSIWFWFFGPSFCKKAHSKWKKKMDVNYAKKNSIQVFWVKGKKKARHRYIKREKIQR